jgi:hypothetical protein
MFWCGEVELESRALGPAAGVDKVEAGTDLRVCIS